MVHGWCVCGVYLGVGWVDEDGMEWTKKGFQATVTMKNQNQP